MKTPTDDKKVIYIIDDNADFLKRFEEAFGAYYEIKGMTKITTFYAELKNKEPDLIVIDVELHPKTDNSSEGFDLAKLIRSDYDIPIVFVTIHNEFNQDFAFPVDGTILLKKDFNIDTWKRVFDIEIYNSSEEALIVSDLHLSHFHFNAPSIVLNDIHWHCTRNINILAGRNGYGKTLLLQALAALLKGDNDYFKHLRESEEGGFGELSVSAELPIEGEDDKTPPLKKSYTNGAWEGKGKTIPVLAFSGVRNFDRSKVYLPNFLLSQKLVREGSEQFIEGKDSSLLILELFYHMAREYDRGGETFKRPIFQFIEEKIAALTQEVFEFVEYRTRPRDDTSFNFYVRTEGNDTPVKFQHVSQGALSLIAIFGVTYRFLEQKKTEDLKDPCLAPGIVIIDEIDAHLHPYWQQKIVTMLRDTFPNVQFFMTAHNPFIIAGCLPGEVSVLYRTDDNRFSLDTYHANFVGEEISNINELVFGVDKNDKDIMYIRSKMYYEKKELLKEAIQTMEQEEKTPEKKAKLAEYQLGWKLAGWYAELNNLPFENQ